MYTRNRITLGQCVVLAAALGTLLAVITLSVTSLVRQKDDTLYGERLGAILGRLETEQAALAKSGLDGVEAYVQSTQKTIVADLAQAKLDGGAYLLVLDGEGRVVLNRPGAPDLAGSPTVKQIQAQAGRGTLELELAGTPVWMAHARFAPWSWDVCYVMPLDAKNGPVRSLLLKLVGLAVLALAVGVGIAWFGAVKVGRMLRVILEEVDRLRQAVATGNLSVRGDVARVDAELRPIVQGFNETMDAFVKPISLTAEYVDRMGKGDLPPRITAEYPGDFNVIKESLNRCIGAVEALAADVIQLSQAAVEGKLSTRADASRHAGDYSKIVSGMNATLDAVIDPLHEASQVLERLARRDLDARVTGRYQGDHARITEALNATGEALQSAMAQVAQSVAQVSTSAGQIASSSQAVASGASEQASALEETGASLESMASVTKHAADSAQQANGLAQRAKAAAGDGSSAMEQMTAAMAKIKAAAGGTSQIIKDINEIAFQTNLLALNAAVEAARAGDAGRGFAVVAEEVRSLALRSKEAANKTEELIRQSVTEAGEGEVTARRVNDKFGEIAASVSKVSGIVAEIAASAREQSSGIDQINRAMAQVNQVTQQNAANSEQSSSAAAELSGQSEKLATMIATFRIGSEKAAPGHDVKPPNARRNGASNGSLALSAMRS